MFTNKENAPLQLIEDEELKAFHVKLYIKREDLIHPFISGNKWRKLKYNFLEARKSGFKKILTFGGAFSNHINAVAAAGNEFGFETMGIIRGEECFPLNSTLSFASNKGMRLIFVERHEYKKGIPEKVKDRLNLQLGEYYIIPEGGTNQLAVKGVSEIVGEIPIKFDYLCSPVGTGGTLAGLISSVKEFQFSVLGFSSLKNADYLKPTISELSNNNERNWQIFNDYSFGGYAKFDEKLVQFINDFKSRYQIQLDPIYTGKMLFGLFDLIKNGYFKKGSTIIAIHTGGLQGIVGFNQRFGNLLNN